MSPIESIMWKAEADPLLRSDIMAVIVLDRPPQHEIMRARLASAFDELPRLRQRVLAPPLQMGTPQWIDDEGFDLDSHLRRAALPEQAGPRELLDLAAGLWTAPLDRCKPLWEVTIVTGLTGGKAALVHKAHHAVADAHGWFKFFRRLLDGQPDPGPGTQRAAENVDANTNGPQQAVYGRTLYDGVEPSSTTPLDLVGELLRETLARPLRITRGGLDAATELLREPRRAPDLLQRALDIAGSIGRQGLTTGQALSQVMQRRSLDQHFETHTLSRDRMSKAARSFGGSVNDLFVAGILGGLAAYHEHRGIACDELRMATPVMRRGNTNGMGHNHFLPLRVVLPTELRSPQDRFAKVKHLLARVRSEPVLAVADDLAGIVDFLPAPMLAATMGSQSRTVDFTTTTVPGPGPQRFFAGAHVETCFPFGPRVGCAVNATALCWSDRVDTGLNIDPAAVDEPSTLLECLDDSFAALGVAPV